MRALNPLKEYPYVLEDDRSLPRSEQTIWWLKHRGAKSYWDAQDMITRGIKVHGGWKDQGAFEINIPSGDLQFETLKSGISRVENFKDEAGNEIQYPGSDASDEKLFEFFSRLRAKHRRELAEAINEGDFLRESEIKN